VWSLGCVVWFPDTSFLLNTMIHSSPACSRKKHFGSYLHRLSLHFWKRLFPRLETMTSWSQGNNFTAAPGLPFECDLASK
jgi:hypothetical protein